MPLILNIDTATEIASVCISENAQPLSYRQNAEQKEHASFVHSAIAAMLKETGNDLNEMDAIAVTSGPGSYTGLRVGMATAKGFCYALRKPLITVNTLRVMAYAALTQQALADAPWGLLCPMIDARRMEVYTAIYDHHLEIILEPTAMVVDEFSFHKWLDNQQTIFFGSGSAKLTSLLTHENASFVNDDHSALHLAALAQQDFADKRFADVAYAEPLYLKEFHSTALH